MRWRIAQRLELTWWKRYLSDRDVDEYLAWKRDYWKSFLEQIKLESPEGKVLDAGCGPAGINLVLEKAEVTALDPLLDQYRQNLNLPSTKQLDRSTFKALGIEDYYMIEHYDVIFCLNAINHVKDIEKALHNLVESLQPGGRLVLSIDCHNFRLFKWLFRLLPLDVLHPHQFDLREYQDMLKGQDISIERSVKIKSGFIFNYYALVGRRS